MTQIVGEHQHLFKHLASNVLNNSAIPGGTVAEALTNLASAFVRQRKVIDIVDASVAPPTEVSGDRYILDTTGPVHADWDGALNNDIVQFNGTSWVAYTPEEGRCAYVDNQNNDALFVDDGTPAWELIPTKTTETISEPGSDSVVPTEKAVVDYAGSARYRRQPVANLTSLFAVVSPIIGETRRVLDLNKVYSRNGSLWLIDGTGTTVPGAFTNDLGDRDASTNTPAITSGVGVLGDRYTVSVAGTTDIDGIADRGVGDYVWYDGVKRGRVNNQVGSSSFPVATQPETDAGTLDNVAITPLKLSNYVKLKGIPTTVGVGGEYLTVGAAIAAGKYYLILVGNTTEIVDISSTANLFIISNKRSNTINLGGYFLTTTGTLTFNNLIVTFSNTVSATVGAMYGNPVTLYDCTVTNTSTTAGKKPFRQGTKLIAYNTTFNFPNTASTGLGDSGVYLGSYKFYNVVLNGGGTNTSSGLLVQDANSDCFVNGLRITGTRNAASGIVLSSSGLSAAKGICNVVCTYDTSIAINGVIASNINTVGNVSLSNSAVTTITNFIAKSFTFANGPKLHLSNGVVTGSQPFGQGVANDTVTAGAVTFNSAVTVGCHYAQFRGCRFLSTLTFSNTYYGSSMVGCYCVGLVTIGGLRRMFESNIFLASVTVNSTGRHVKLTNNIVGDTTSGSKTINITAGAENTLISGNSTEAAIVDAGTGTQAIVNFIL